MAAIYPFPRHLAGTVTSRFDLVKRSVHSTSPFTARRQVQGPIAWFWTASFTKEPQTESQWHELIGFIDRLDGIAGQVRLFDPLRIYPRGHAAGISQSVVDDAGNGQGFSDGETFSDGKGFVDGGTTALAGSTALRGAKELKIVGLVASRTDSLLAGDLFEVGGYIYHVVSNAASNASGETLAQIRPPLRTNIAVNDVVNFAYPSSPFTLMGEGSAGFERDILGMARVGFEFVEVVP